MSLEYLQHFKDKSTDIWAIKSGKEKVFSILFNRDSGFLFAATEERSKNFNMPESKDPTALIMVIFSAKRIKKTS